MFGGLPPDTVTASIIRRLEEKLKKERRRNRQLHQENRQLKDKNLLDGLTGVCNREGFTTRYQSLVGKYGRPRRRRSELQSVGEVIIVLDGNGFGRVNKRFGHDAGDEVIKRTAQELKHCLRATDTIARLGGDEFAIHLHSLTFEEGQDAIARIVDHLTTISYAFTRGKMKEKETVTMTISLGAIWLGNGVEFPLYRLLTEADQRERVAKRLSRRERNKSHTVYERL